MKEKTKRTNEEWGTDAARKRLLRAVGLSERLLLRRLERALDQEDEIDQLLLCADAAAREEGMSEKARKELIASASSIRCEDLSKLVAIIGVLAEHEREIRGSAGGEQDGREGEKGHTRFEDM